MLTQTPRTNRLSAFLACRAGTPLTAAIRRRFGLALLAALALPGSAAVADTIFTSSSGTGKGLPLEVTIQKLEGGQLQYVSSQSGTTAFKPFEQIITIKAAGEPALSAAEQAFADKKWDEAAQGYSKAMDASTKDWVKARATVRLIEAAKQSGQFAPAAKAFIELTKSDLAAASKMKPAVPADKPEQVKPALDDVGRALAGGGLKAEQKALLQSFQAEMMAATGRGAEAAAILKAAAPTVIPGGTGVAAAGPADPAGRKAAAAGALVIADEAAKAGQYAQVLSAIDAAKASFADPADQARALFLTAQAKEQLAGTDPAKLRDAAVAYMRVVAHFDGVPAAKVPDALWKVGEIQEKLKNTDEAAELFKKLSEDPSIKGTAMATAAAKKATDLRGK